METKLLRERFLKFFQGKRHKIVEPDSLVPRDDTTVLFTPAGMNQFKKEFLGFNSGFARAATCQRCLRTDDLDKVGKTSGHHTFFEMLGNFSFGDYFKKEAIEFAWEFLTKELKISGQRLWVSIYKDDHEAYKIWRQIIKIPEEKIIKLGDKENFWPSEAKMKGPNGPCGPCSEIFFDQGDNIGCQRSNCNPACDCDRFIEVWNLVFTQFNRKETGILEPLPKKNIDTGMGLERLAAVMQGVKSNFQTDLFRPIIDEIVSEYESIRVSDNKQAIFAVADHLRAIAFAIYDGVLPSNEARGYVVRKLIRKSTLHLRELGIMQAFLYKLVPVLSETMNSYYPELEGRRENIAQVILCEEKNFISTLNSSEDLFKQKFKEKVNAEEAGIIAFKLYDTYGIPWELTSAWAKKHNLKISVKTYNQELARQKERSKLQTSMKGDVFAVNSLDYKVRATKFLGYKENFAKAKVLKIVKNNLEVKKATKNDETIIILDNTPFYPESGGQVGDRGEISKGKNIFKVKDARMSDKIILHIGAVIDGSFKPGDLVTAKIDTERRLSVARNHSATHLLQAALRKVLGTHVQQQGSLVAEDRLRFDFTHFKDIDDAELDRIEEVVNGYILENQSLQKKDMPLAEAKKRGALAFFGEKYEDKVRLVSIGDFSKELCGGTHLENTGQIGLFKIIQEGSVASGIRRIEAITGDYAYRLVKKDQDLLKQASSVLKVSKENLVKAVRTNLERLKALEKSQQAQKMQEIKGSIDAWIKEAEVINGIGVITKIIENSDMELLRNNVDMIKLKAKSAVVALGSEINHKALLVMGVTEDLCQRGVDASKLIREISHLINGSGGGRCDFAQAGGNKPEDFEKAFAKLKKIIEGL